MPPTLCEFYKKELGAIQGISFMPDNEWNRPNYWLSCITLNDTKVHPLDIMEALEAENIESRPIWKPMHMQPVFKGCRVVGGSVAEDLFERGMCLPSGTQLSREEQDRVIETIRKCRK